MAPRECETVKIVLLLFQLESSFNSFCAQTENKRRKSLVETSQTWLLDGWGRKLLCRDCRLRASIYGWWKRSQEKKMITKGQAPNTKVFLARILIGPLPTSIQRTRGRRGNEKLMLEFEQILFHHRPIVTTALVNGYTSIVIVHVVVNCLYVATGVGNQDPPPPPNPLDLIHHHHFPGWRRRLHYSRGTTTRWGDCSCPDQCRMHNTTTTTTRFIGRTWRSILTSIRSRSTLIPQLPPLYSTSPPTCPPSKADTSIVWASGWIPIINMTTQSGSCWRRCTDLNKCKKLCPFAFQYFFAPNK